LTGVNVIFGGLMLKFAVAEFAEASVAVTVYVDGLRFGTIKVDVKPPVELVNADGRLSGPRDSVTVELPANPDPVIETIVPDCPFGGERLMFGTTLKFCDIVFVPSLALIVCEPATACGIVIVAVNPPLEFEVAEPTDVPSNSIVIGDEGL
jgi:hypothetical protein